MNLLLIHQAFAGPDDPGGTRHFELGRYLAAAGHSLTVIASDVSYLTGTKRTETREVSSVEPPSGVRILRSYTYSALHRSFVWRVVSFLTFMVSSWWTGLRCRPIDLVMGTTPPIFQAVSAWLVAFMRRRPFLLEVRDLWPEFAIGMGVLRNPLLIRLSRLLEAFLYRRATHIVVNSPAYRNYLVGKGVAPSKVTVICNGVDPTMFDPAARGERFRREWKTDGAFIVTYAGALGAANDISTVLRAAERLRSRNDIRFMLVGDGKDRPRLQAEAERLHLANVTFAGAKPKSEIKEVLAASDACLAILQDIPMFTTTYPNKVFDYMAAGRPTILVIDGVIREVIESAGGGIFVRPGDDIGLASAVESLCGDQTQAAAMGMSARSYVEKHFNRADQAREFVNLIERFDRRAEKEVG